MGFVSPIGVSENRAGIPLVFDQHFTANLDNWDPAVTDGLAQEREVILFEKAGVASFTGEVPKTLAGMAKNARAFIDALRATDSTVWRKAGEQTEDPAPVCRPRHGCTK